MYYLIEQFLDVNFQALSPLSFKNLVLNGEGKRTVE